MENESHVLLECDLYKTKRDKLLLWDTISIHLGNF